MNFITYVNTKSYINKRPVDNVDVNTFSAKSPPAKYYRKTSSCCENNTSRVFTNVKCCVKPTYSANTVLSKDYYTTHAQYIKARCKSFDQNYTNLNFNPANNTAQPNCTNAQCNSTIYTRNNETFANQGAVSSSARILQKKYNNIQKDSHFNPRQSNYTGDNTLNKMPVQPNICQPYRRNGDKLSCE
jgi:hypothetical protein